MTWCMKRRATSAAEGRRLKNELGASAAPGLLGALLGDGEVLYGLAAMT